ncbi:MAG: hypothetical protein EBU46_01330 [Nitrosomonadaceae bacterium]|nr:hypothetical protein [Nitrosomonadaceae bacterium]
MLGTIEYLDIMNQTQQTKINIVTTGSGVQSSAAPENGIYIIWWDVPCLLKINSTVGDTVTADTGLEMTSAGFLPFIVNKNMFITAKATVSSGTVRWMRVG